MRKTMAAALFVGLSALGSSAACADSQPTAVIAPVLGHLVGFTLPSGFVLQQEQVSSEGYFRSALLKGEKLETWSQMISVTGAKDTSTDPKKSAQLIAANIASSIQKLCPDTFSVKPLGPSTINSQDAFVAVTSCGKVGPDNASETALTIAITSGDLVYTIQWAERTPSNAENLTIDEAKWKSRLQQLVPLRVCSIVAGEKPPYPSCAKK